SRASQKRIEAIVARLEEAQQPAPQVVETAPVEQVFVPVRSGMNLNIRTQALRLLRRGEDVSHVAAALAVAGSEIEVLIRGQEFSIVRAAEATASGTEENRRGAGA